MASTLLNSLGGLGLFLLGMVIMTDGLRALAGNAMRKALMRFTHTPLSGVMTGAIATAMLQSSSATTVATVGFVGAGLISFTAALGIIFGANIGTTMTGWLVAILGFKLKLGSIALPLIFIGTSLRLFLRGRLAQAGYALAGFGLIFVGVTTMQAAMGEVAEFITLDNLPANNLWGRLQLLLLGTIFTVLTQSSSAGVAIVLTALHAGAIEFPQGAVLVIGMDVGTTITALLATIGSPINARRTGLSHVAYNLISATVALAFLTPYMHLAAAIAPGQLVANPEIALVGFHTGFNIIGVAVMLPFIRQFAWLIKTIVPSQVAAYRDRLDDVLLKDPNLALNEAQAAIESEFLALLGHVRAILGESQGQRANLLELQTDLDETQTFLDRIELKANTTPNWERLVEMIHALDHMQRLHERCEEEEDRASTVTATAELNEERRLLLESLEAIVSALDTHAWGRAANRAKAAADSIHQKVKPYRDNTVTQVASGQIDTPTGTARLEAIRWLRRTSKHITRITEHESRAIAAIGSPSTPNLSRAGIQ